MSHKRFSPSGSKSWLACTGSIKLIESLTLPDDTNAASELGTGVHEVGENCLLSDDTPSMYLNTKMNGHVMTQDCIDAVTIYVNYCRDLMEDCGSSYLVEGKFVHPKYEDLGGTADFCGYDEVDELIEIVDYKNGEGLDVWAMNNTQLMIYALLYYYDLMQHNPKAWVEMFRLTICQPRHRKHQDDGGLDSWEISLEDLLAWEKETLLPSIKLIEKGKGVFMPSDSACQWCKAWNDCKAKDLVIDDWKELMDDEEKEETAFPLISEEDQEKRIKWVLDNEKFLSTYIKRATDYAKQKLLGGEQYVGRKVTQGLKNRSYVSSYPSDKILDEAITSFKTVIHKSDLMVKPTILPPAQLETALKSLGVKTKIIKSFMEDKTERLDGEYKLVLLSAKDKAVIKQDEFDTLMSEDETNG